MYHPYNLHANFDLIFAPGLLQSAREFGVWAILGCSRSIVSVFPETLRALISRCKSSIDPHVNESCLTSQWVISHTSMSRLTRQWVVSHTSMRHVSHVNEACLTRQWVFRSRVLSPPLICTHLCLPVADILRSSKKWTIQNTGSKKQFECRLYIPLWRPMGWLW